MGADLRTGVDGAAVEAHTGAAGRAVGGDGAGVRAEAVGRVLGGDAALDGEAADLEGVLRDAQLGQGGAGGDAQLRAHQVHVRDLLGHGVLHLDAGVHLDEHVLARTLARRVHEELDGARVDVPHLLGEGDGVPVQGLPDLLVQVRGRGHLDDLLVAALERAVPLEEVHDVALAVGEDLHLDVPRPQDGLLEEHGGVAEGGVRLAHRCLEGAAQVLAALDAAHAAAAAAGDGLDEDGEADLLGLLQEPLDVGARVRGGQGGDARTLGRAQGLDLVAGQLEDVGGRADEGDPVLGRGAGQAGVLRQEAVARVDRVGPGVLRHADDLVHVEVGAHGVALLADAVGLVRLLAVDRIAVLVGEDGDGAGAQLVAGAEGADGDLAAVGHQDLGEDGAGSGRPGRVLWRGEVLDRCGHGWECVTPRRSSASCRAQSPLRDER